jgi:branched-chain amino acid aminotransferase
MPDSVWLKQRLLSLISANRATDCTLRVVVVRNTGSVWAGPSDRDFDVVGLTAELTDWGESVRLGVVPHGRNSASRFAGAKVTSWGMNLTWYEEAHRSGFDEVLLLNERGEVSECTSANIFAVDGDQVCTPPLSSGCLPGVTRELLLEQIRVDGFDVCERVLTLVDLKRSDEVFITSTTRDLLPVAAIQGISIAGRSAVCERFRSVFRNYIETYTDAHQQVQTNG